MVITAPLRVRMDLSPVKAVVPGLSGMVLVPCGSLGPGTLVATELGGQDIAELGYWSALLTLPVLLVSMTTVLVVVTARPSARHVALGAAVIVTQWVDLVASSHRDPGSRGPSAPPPRSPCPVPLPGRSGSPPAPSG